MELGRQLDRWLMIGAAVGLGGMLLLVLVGGRERTTTNMLAPVPDDTRLEIIALGATSEAIRFFNSLHDLV